MLVATSLARRVALSRLAAVLIAAAALAGCTNSTATGDQRGPQPSPFVPTQVQPSSRPPGLPSVQPPHSTPVQPQVRRSAQPPDPPADEPWVPESLTEPGLDLRAGPVDVPLELQIPSLRVSAPVIGVGLTASNVMDAPKGPISDPVWQSAFWYRGGGIPGDFGTATFAGHVNDPLARPAVFARLEDLRPGDLIVVRDTRNGRDMQFMITSTEIYSAEQASDPAILAQVYGVGPVSGQGPLPAPDGLAHLTLVTCTGAIVDGAFDHHVVVYATRSQ